MKLLLSMGIMLLMTTQLGAETYSWVDDQGTYNFTEDLSSVPKKYQKKVNRLGDMGKDSTQVSELQEKKSGPAESGGVKPASTSGADKPLYNGKSYDDWRQEMTAHEAELSKLEQRLDLMYKESATQKGLTGEQFAAFKKEYDDTRTAYEQKYKVYSELIESARKAGLVIEIRK